MRHIFVYISLLLLSAGAQATTLYADFDYTPGTITFNNGFAPSNFVESSYLYSPTAGTQLFSSAIGIYSGPFLDQGFTMDLGGVIEDKTYTVQFNLGDYSRDFDELYIGSANGSMVWTDTPTPSGGVWQTWTGIFTPDAADIGNSWKFHAMFDLYGGDFIKIDLPGTGFATAAAVPLPAAVWLFGSALAGLGWMRRR